MTVPVLQMRKLRLGDDKELIPLNENHSPCLPFEIMENDRQGVR